MTAHARDNLELANDVKERIRRLAELRKQDPSELLNEWLREMLDAEEFRADLVEARDRLDAGESIEDDKTEAWLKSWGTHAELEPPTCE